MEIKSQTLFGVLLLLNSGVSGLVDSSCNIPENPSGEDLYMASKSGNTCQVKGMLLSGVDTSYIQECEPVYSFFKDLDLQECNYTALHVAGNSEIISLLLDYDPSLSAVVNGFEFTPLHTAKTVEIAKALLDHDPELINQTSTSMDTALHTARSADIAELLLATEPDLINMKNDYMGTALHTAKDVDIARVLIKQNPDLVNMVDATGFTPVHTARSAEIIELLLMKNPNLVYAVTNDGDSPLNYARSLQIAQLLMKYNRNVVNIINEYGETVLHYVRDAEVARLILTANPDLVNIRSFEGETALYALMYSYDESKFDDVNDFNKIIAVLLEFGADPADTDEYYGRNALHIARTPEIVKMIVEKNQSLINSQDLEGYTALGLACVDSDDVSLVSSLVDAGADINIVNSNGRSPSQMCCDSEEFYFSQDKCALMI